MTETLSETKPGQDLLGAMVERQQISAMDAEALNRLRETGEVQAEVLDAHKHIVKAISDGNARRAESLMHKHLEMSLEYCERNFGTMIDQPVQWH